MPFVRFSHDKRGYEHVYLVEASKGRGAQARVLYWYRTPPGIKVGREPFDEAVRRALEAQNPSVVFDWKQIASTPKPPPDAEHWRERRKADRAAKKARMEDVQEPTSAATEESADDRAEAAPVVTPSDDLGAAQTVGEVSAVEVSAVERVPAIVPPAQSERRRGRRRGGRRRRRGSGGTGPGIPLETAMDPPPLQPGAGQDHGPVVSDPGGRDD